MPPHPLTNIEMLKYYQNEPKFNWVYSRNKLSKIKDGHKQLILMSMNSRNSWNSIICEC